MPHAIDYRDHPKNTCLGISPLNLNSADLPPKTHVVYGNISSTLLPFLQPFLLRRRLVLLV